AVMRRAEVTVNGQAAGTHDDGYLPFTLDITALLRKGENELAVLCVNDLPDGLNVGGGEKFRRNLEFSGVFYKTWAFQSSEKRVPTPDHDPKNDDPKNDDALETLARENDLKKGKWTCSPVLVGTIARVEPIQKDEPRSPVPPSAVFATFAVLACAWIILRRIAAARNVNKIERRRNNSR
ncbi:MAG: hypothetical protein II655_03480, partial [Thermoguttaceae bacterium]|nr:hypothetical protein [Thermoguttaceae bacterium]